MTSITYKEAGVDIDAGNQLVDKIKPLAAQTNRLGTIGSLGGFGGLFDLKKLGYTDPLLVSGTDGVGTKLKIAIDTNTHDTIGIDLVAMCVNDILTQGAEPLFFLDYFATGKLDITVAEKVIQGIQKGCKKAGASLLGGETAEMPDFYPKNHYDLAGFSVGIVERERLLPQLDTIKAGDILYGMASSGVHANGFSLVRKILEKEELSYQDKAPWDKDKTVGSSLLLPTEIYVSSLLPLIKEGVIQALSHITGGGLSENIPRMLPKDRSFLLNQNLCLPPLFQWLQEKANLSDAELYKTFNCGIGMVALFDREYKPDPNIFFEIGSIV